MSTTNSFAAGDTVHGFTVLRTVPLTSMAIAAVEFRHAASGARLLHLAADDAENLFAVAFRTPPPDDTGLPHILEHSVLCGSKRFPVKDPFVELLKTSLATFLNAFTYPDRTVYPCSSMNAKDFHHLLRVYCDAVFQPLLTPDHFRQEGHHLEFTPDRRLMVKGVVYNEMRGVYSDPDGILDRRVQAELFASNEYGRDFGGDPKAIPSLTYAQYLDFHKTYYHPSNAWILSYGNVPAASTLAILDQEYLRGYAAVPVQSTIKPLSRWPEPRRAVHAYPLDAESPSAARTDIAVAMATNDRRDVLANLAMKVVDLYLLDNAASPLRKALIDSKLGEELGMSGHADYQRDTFFTVTLKGSEADRAEAVEELILRTVAEECRRGFDAGKVESALHYLELSSREIRPQYPLHLLDRVYAAWLYDSDPLEQVDISGHLDALREKVTSTPRFLEDTAKRWLVDNPHRLRVTLVPDKEYIEKNDRDTAREMAAILAAMTPDEQAGVEETARRLEAMQSAGNTPEALATLPRLARGDVSPVPLPLDSAVETVAGCELIHVPMYAGGVGYFSLNLTLSGLDDDDIMLLPLLCDALGKTGAAGLDFAQMAEREAAATGALDFAAGMTPHVDGADLATLRLNIWLKALDSDWEQALGIMADRLLRPDFGDRDRLRDIILQNRVHWQTSIVPSGNAYAASYAASRLTPAHALAEKLSGCTQARYSDAMAAALPGALQALPDRLTALREKVLSAATPAASVLAADASRDATRSWLAAHAGAFRGDGRRQSLPPVRSAPARIGLAAPADVAFSSLVMPGPAMSGPGAAALILLGVQLSYGYLWNEVRVKGGAYGVRAGLDGGRGTFAFTSFRDPNIQRTLDAFRSVRRHVLEDMDLSPSGLEQAIIGAVKTLDAPLRPPTAVATALMRRLSGETDAFRQEFRTRLLSLAADDIRSAADTVFSRMDEGAVCVLSSREKLEEENAAMAEPLTLEPLWEKA